MKLATLKTSKIFKKDPAITFEDYGKERYWHNPDQIIELYIGGYDRFFLSHIEVSDLDVVTLYSTDDKDVSFDEDEDFELNIYEKVLTA